MWNFSNYGNDLDITKNQAEIGYHQGECENDILELMEIPSIKRQLKKLDKQQLKKELKQYGAWDKQQLENHQENLKRWLWISCGDIIDNN